MTADAVDRSSGGGDRVESAPSSSSSAPGASTPRTGPPESATRARPAGSRAGVPAAAAPVDTDAHVDVPALSPPPANNGGGEDAEDITPLPSGSAMLGVGPTPSPAEPSRTGDGERAAGGAGAGYTFGRKASRGGGGGTASREGRGGSKSGRRRDPDPGLTPERDQELLEANSTILSASQDYLADLFKMRDGLEKSKQASAASEQGGLDFGPFARRRLSGGSEHSNTDWNLSETNLMEEGGGTGALGSRSDVNLHQIKGSVSGSGSGDGFDRCVVFFPRDSEFSSGLVCVHGPKVSPRHHAGRPFPVFFT